MMVVGRNDYGEWTIYATDAEFHDLHHALRMLAKHSLTPQGEELQRITDSANALWNAHAARVASNQESQP